MDKEQNQENDEKENLINKNIDINNLEIVNLEKKDIENKKSKLFFKKNFDLKTENNFNFETVNWKVDGLIFLFSTLVIPFVISAFFAIFKKFNPDFNKSKFQMIFFVLQMLSILVGLIFNIIRNNNKFYKNGQFWFYLFTFVPTCLAFLFEFIVYIIFKNNKNFDAILYISGLVSMIVGEIIILLIVLIKDKILINRIKETFKTKWKQLLVVTIVGVILFFILVILLVNYFIENKLLNLGPSDNENSLKWILKGQYGQTFRRIALILLFLLTVVLAPFIEEVCLRDSYNLNISNKWLGLFASGFYFGFLHYGTTFDFEHLLSYTAAGLFLSGMFSFTNGNITFTWMLHLINNLFSYGATLMQ